MKPLETSRNLMEPLSKPRETSLNLMKPHENLTKLHISKARVKIDNNKQQQRQKRQQQTTTRTRTDKMALPYITLGAYCLPAYSVTPFWAAAHLYFMLRKASHIRGSYTKLFHGMKFMKVRLVDPVSWIYDMNLMRFQ